MKAAILHDAHKFIIEEKPLPQIQADELLIGIKACGVCHSEIHQWDHKIEGLEYPRFIGHEAAGIVEDIGEQITKFKRGDRVALWVDSKGYAEKIAVKEDRVFPLAKKIPFEEAMAEPIACTTNGVIKTNIQLGDKVILVGTGFMGLILLQQIKISGASEIIAVDIRDEILELALKLGATKTINSLKENPVEVVNKLTDGKGADICFEVGGNQTTLDLAPQLCKMEGKLVIFGYHPGQRIIKDLGYWNWMAFDIINAHFRDLRTILKGSQIGVELLNKNMLNMKPLITHKFPLDKINEAFKAAKEKPKGFIKAVVVME